MKVCLGGTFDILHDGHKALLRAAFQMGGRVLIGLTSDRFARKGRKEVNPFSKRRAALERYLGKAGYGGYEIVEIDDAMGPAVGKKDLEVIVASEGTVANARLINRRRERAGLPRMIVLVVPHVLAEDCTPISSRRIRKGEIDAKGHLLRPLVVALGSRNRNKRLAAEKVFSRFFRNPRVRTVKVISSVPEQPFGRDTVRGAVERARRVLSGKADFGVGIEAGLFWDPTARKHFDVQWCAIIDRRGKVTLGHGPGFCYPDVVEGELERGMTVSESMKRLSQIRDIGNKMGAVGFLSKGALNRDALTEQAILMALIPRISRELYL